MVYCYVFQLKGYPCTFFCNAEHLLTGFMCVFGYMSMCACTFITLLTSNFLSFSHTFKVKFIFKKCVRVIFYIPIIEYTFLVMLSVVCKILRGECC